MEFQSLVLSVEDIAREIGYGEIPPEEDIQELIASLLARVATLATPRYAFQIFEGEARKDCVCIRDSDPLETGSVLTSLLQNSTRFALFAATVGENFRTYQEEVNSENNILKSYLLDVIGTCAVEKTGDCLETSLKEIIGEEKHTNRFSPGYCGWHLSGQRTLFRLMGGTPCGITLSDVCLMNPIKSISGIIGVGTDVVQNKYGCHYCEMKTCYKRKRKGI